MTPSERERRIEAAKKAFTANLGTFHNHMGAALDAADKAVPTVSAEVHALVLGECQKDRDIADLRTALLAIVNTREGTEPDFDNVWQSIARAALSEAAARHPSFSGEEGARA